MAPISGGDSLIACRDEPYARFPCCHVRAYPRRFDQVADCDLTAQSERRTQRSQDVLRPRSTTQPVEHADVSMWLQAGRQRRRVVHRDAARYPRMWVAGKGQTTTHFGHTCDWSSAPTAWPPRHSGSRLADGVRRIRRRSVWHRVSACRSPAGFDAQSAVGVDEIGAEKQESARSLRSVCRSALTYVLAYVQGSADTG